MLFLLMTLCVTTTSFAKNIQTVIFQTTPEMHCENCENKIKTNIRFEKGVKEIVTNLKDKTVTVKYDADKTSIENIVKGFAKINYKATVSRDSKTKSPTPHNKK